MTPSVLSGTATLIGSGTLTRLLSYAQVMPATAMSNALEQATSNHV